MRNVILVSEKQLQRVIPRFQRDRSFSLAAAEMEIIEVVRYRSIERWQFGIDQQMVMP